MSLFNKKQSPPPPGPSYEAVEAAIDEVEAEMKRIGLWDIVEPTPQAIANGGAFGGQTMAFEQWLRWVFVPRVRQILAEKGQFPPSSQVSDQAFREWRMWGDAPNVTADFTGEAEQPRAFKKTS